MAASKHESIDSYIKTFPVRTQAYLQEVRELIKKEVPDAEETISYSMPTFNLNGQYLIYFAGYSKHISIYPVPAGDPVFEKAFAGYKTSGKGTIQFPLDKPLPIALIRKIIRFRMKDNNAKAGKK